MLGAKIGEPPGLRRIDAIVAVAGEAGAVGQHELDMLAQLLPCHRAADRAQRMIGRCDRNDPDVHQRVPLQRLEIAVVAEQQADRAGLIQQQLRRRAQRVDEDARRRRGKARAEKTERVDECGHRKHGVDDEPQFGLDAGGDALGVIAQRLHLLGDEPGAGQQRPPRFREARAVAARSNRTTPSCSSSRCTA